MDASKKGKTMTSAVAPLLGRRVLIVEDDYFLAQSMQSAFAKLGAEVIGPVPTVDAALDLIDESQTLDAAVLDLNLRGRMAYPIADALRSRGIPFVFATGYDVFDIDAGYTEVQRCEKPVNPQNVADMLFAEPCA
jgi:CheY-like chemotaxis protein